ncbi:ABC transporter ATP-binding protein [Endozoicomonas sp. G2_1]|uniref:ABC transporter ATP-binding protein n=1 Tax=Endozoicomonas sp. G2_1 TaxID=2821091 RepID=UPI001ADBED4C|nr:ABC transporter ATP-binding protein [Endozoicomonas sp. G2_1]MBO9489849.1 ABC transporter ATP-binding protein [Endozoicomonas sp. G2_1]
MTNNTALVTEKTNTIIKLENVSKVFSNKQEENRVLQNISFDICEGDFIAIVGPSGSGKSTLLNILVGFDTPTFGEVTLHNKKISDLKSKQLTNWRKENLGFVFQSHNLIPVLSVYQNVELPLLLNNVPKSERFTTVLNTLEVVGLKEKFFNRPAQLSGGEEQRVAIARAMVHNPSIIIMDEPTGSLDRKNANHILNTLKIINQKYNTTIVMVTHDVKATEYAKSVIDLDKGSC